MGDCSRCEGCYHLMKGTGAFEGRVCCRINRLHWDGAARAVDPETNEPRSTQQWYGRTEPRVYWLASACTPEPNCLPRTKSGKPVKVRSMRTRKVVPWWVTDARALHAQAPDAWGCRRLGKMFGVHHTTMARALRGESWGEA